MSKIYKEDKPYISAERTSNSIKLNSELIASMKKVQHRLKSNRE